jgi:hypothetical protein
MSLFSEIESTIERGFRRFTERVFGPAESDELLLVHHGILEDVETKIQTLARGRRVFPYASVTVTLVAPQADRRALLQAAFAEGGRLESDIREALEGAGCEVPRAFAVEVRTAETGAGVFAVEYGSQPLETRSAPAAPAAASAPAPAPASVVVVRGKADQDRYVLDKARINIGRMAELMDSEQRVIRRNHIVFQEGADEANATVSRGHAHIRLQDGDYRICDDESEYGTRVFRDGRGIEAPAGNRRGELLRPGDEIYLGRACLRFER